MARLANAPMVASSFDLQFGKRRHLQNGIQLWQQICPSFACADGERQQSEI
jgi:hypothetical protein